MQEQPNDFRALFGAATAYRMSGDLISARQTLARAAQAHPDNTHVHFEHGVVLEYLGEFDAATRSYQRALETEPLNYKARQALVQLHAQSVAANSIAELERLFAGPDPDGWRTLHIGHALAKTFEDLGDLPRSFEWFARAKQRRREIAPTTRRERRGLSHSSIAAAAWKAGRRTSRFSCAACRAQARRWWIVSFPAIQT